MPNYDFLKLSFEEFENLSRDLLQKKLDLFLETFTSGKDQGIDLRHSRDGQNKIIVQAKRYNSFSNLLSKLKEEIPKLEKLKPERYILTTSVGLTPKNKAQIRDLFPEYIKENEDILGKEDLNNLLRIHPEIEKNHFKLWITSTNILELILNRTFHNKTLFEKETIEGYIQLFVYSDAFTNAYNILNKNHFVIISGIPGIGKTTLARMLVFHLLANDFEEFIFLSNTINEAYQFYDPDKKQVFLFDDFLGRSFLSNKLIHNEEKSILSFINKIKKSTGKALIFTTREYILNQAKTIYDLFEDNNFSLGKYVLDLGTYSKFVKAKILYNHLFFSDTPLKIKLALLEDKGYLKIINHSNYNPRIIETILKYVSEKPISPNNLTEKCIQYLDNPIEVWNHAFNNQISSTARFILFYMTLNNTPTLLDDLEKLFTESQDGFISKYNIKRDYFSFNSSLREIENSFVKILKDENNKLYLDFINPSINDFLVYFLSTNKNITKDLLQNTIYIDHLVGIFEVGSSYKLSLLENEFFTIKRVSIDSELQEHIENKILCSFNELLRCRLVIYQQFQKTYYQRSQNNIYSKLSIIFNFYGKNISSKLKHFLANTLLRSYNANKSIKNLDLFDVLQVIKHLSMDFPIDKTEYLTYIRKFVNGIYSLEAYLDIRKIFIKDSSLVINEAELIKNIEEFIVEDVEGTNYDDDPEYLLNIIERVENIFDLEFDEIKDMLNKVISEHEMQEELPLYEDEDDFQEDESNDISDIDIMNMFNSLKES